LRIKLASLHGRAGERAPIDQAGFITILLTGHIFIQALPLCFTERLQVAIVNRGIKRESRGVQLLDHGNVELLLCNQKTDVSAPERWRDSGIEKWLREQSAHEPEYLGRIFAGPVSALHSRRHADPCVRPHDGTQDEPLPGCLFEI